MAGKTKTEQDVLKRIAEHDAGLAKAIKRPTMLDPKTRRHILSALDYASKTKSGASRLAFDLKQGLKSGGGLNRKRLRIIAPLLEQSAKNGHRSSALAARLSSLMTVCDDWFHDKDLREFVPIMNEVASAGHDVIPMLDISIYEQHVYNRATKHMTFVRDFADGRFDKAALRASLAETKEPRALWSMAHILTQASKKGVLQKEDIPNYAPRFARMFGDIASGGHSPIQAARWLSALMREDVVDRASLNSMILTLRHCSKTAHVDPSQFMHNIYQAKYSISGDWDKDRLRLLALPMRCAAEQGKDPRNIISFATTRTMDKSYIPINQLRQGLRFFEQNPNASKDPEVFLKALAKIYPSPVISDWQRAMLLEHAFNYGGEYEPGHLIDHAMELFLGGHQDVEGIVEAQKTFIRKGHFPTATLVDMYLEATAGRPSGRRRTHGRK